MASAAVQQAPGNTFDQDIKPFTQSAAKPVKHDVQTELHYHLDDGKPVEPAYVGKPETFLNRPNIAVPLTVHDVAGDEDKYTLDSHGFQFVKHESKEKDFLDEEKIKAEYYPEIEQLLKDSTGASRVLIFDHTIRRQPADTRDVASQLRGPAQRVHIDQSYRASENRVKHHLPDEADALLQKRFQIINVWRPIKTIYRDPLALADANTVSEDDLLVAKLIYPDREGETVAVKPNPSHRWYFKYAQQPDEPLFIKCYDSVTNGVARRIPHTAFVNPLHQNDDPRESIEVRTLVFYD